MARGTSRWLTGWRWRWVVTLGLGLGLGCGLVGAPVRLARAGYTPLSCMPPGSYVAPDFDRLGEQVNELLRAKSAEQLALLAKQGAMLDAQRAKLDKG